MAVGKPRDASVAVHLETGIKLVFACALDWPGWCRSARDEAGAQHVLGGESGYARKAGLRLTEPAFHDAPAVSATRQAFLEVFRPSDGAPLAPNGWPLRYLARRTVWHVLDHVWEIEDRSQGAPE